MVGKAQALAEELGALVIAPDTYRGDWTKFIPKAIFLALSTPQERVNDDLDSVVAWASQQPDADITRLVVMGFCYGGGKAIRYSATRRNPAATVVFYGSPLTDVDVLARLKGPVLLIYGDRDAQFPPAKVHAFRDALVKAGIDVKQSMFPGQGHAFFRNMAQVEAGSGPQRQAWSELLAFLRERLF
ncbi:carboxymethylenebutenolidase [Klebsormidium nitens]|uniref:Carboxymethylenebutenolidase n=1 Tax=Klebsormidium nitens TaxID=105231 RepID=A0A1Y1IJ45_KLENI|nr:carboxymethylenebutenolidase [Klebsormidium nitens]|eukprot:GAQ88138.1 carboxymethylenebutenolidase [Klebsormidium nitens]